MIAMLMPGDGMIKAPKEPPIIPEEMLTAESPSAVFRLPPAFMDRVSSTAKVPVSGVSNRKV